jgi:hypothetical protein
VKGASARARDAAKAAARLRRAALRARGRARRAKIVAHHLNAGRRAARRLRFAHLARHFRGLGLLYDHASRCKTARCTRRRIARIRKYVFLCFLGSRSDVFLFSSQVPRRPEKDP